MQNKIINVIKENLRIYGDIPTDEKLFLEFEYLESGFLDSFAIIQFFISIEEEFGIVIQGEDENVAKNVRTVKDLVRIIEHKINE